MIGQTLAMEGVFSFFLESSFLGAFLFGEKRLGPKAHWFAALLVFLGSWLSGFLIVATNAWMQHPTGYAVGAHGEMVLTSFWGLLLNPWLGWQYLHTMTGAVVTGSLVMAAVGAFYLLTGSHQEHGRTFVRLGVIAGIAASVVMLFPTGDGQGSNIAWNQPVTLAAMEGLFNTAQGAPLAILGQPDMDAPPARQPAHRSARAQFPDLSALESRSEGARFVPAAELAGQRAAALLQLPHHGRAGHDFHRRDGTGRVRPVARARSFVRALCSGCSC